MQERQKKEGKKDPRKRPGKRLVHDVLTLGLLLTAVGLWFTAGAAYGRPQVVYKEARPKKDLTKTIEKKKKETYDRGDRLDPFASYLEKGEKVLQDLEKARKEKLSALERLKALQEARTVLQKLDLAQLKITAIIKGKGGAWAMVKDSTGTGYVVKKGTYIGTKGGVVEKIVRESKKTQFGKTVIRKLIIKEPYLNEEGAIDYKLVEMEMEGSPYD
ncbi:MAG: pilus assembly protein PilP [Deltaproteobacteria bacterium]|nr:pilus assembly protein PilP [Deltaproteobacteria bacterium]